MKKSILSVVVFYHWAFVVNAQRYAVIDSKYILQKIPEYKDAQKRLDTFSIIWQKEIDQKTSVAGSDDKRL
ncbi:MAG: OmpH family outer membrane protein [Ferruginibacter sp.]